MADLSPQYIMSSTLYREVTPKYVLTFGNTTEKYVKTLIDFCNPEKDTTSTLSNVSHLPENFFLVSLKEYCKYFVYLVRCIIYNAINIF